MAVTLCGLETVALRKKQEAELEKSRASLWERSGQIIPKPCNLICHNHMRHINTALYQKAFLSSHVPFLCTNAGNFLQIQFAIVFCWDGGFGCILLNCAAFVFWISVTGAKCELWAHSCLCSADRVEGSLWVWLWRGNWVFSTINLCNQCYEGDCIVSANQQKPPWCGARFSLSVIILPGFKRLKHSATAWGPDTGVDKGQKACD